MPDVQLPGDTTRKQRKQTIQILEKGKGQLIDGRRLCAKFLTMRTPQGLYQRAERETRKVRSYHSRFQVPCFQYPR